VSGWLQERVWSGIWILARRATDGW
jgi:hypothetical protein